MMQTLILLGKRPYMLRPNVPIKTQLKTLKGKSYDVKTRNAVYEFSSRLK